jgi:hypothetical protein
MVKSASSKVDWVRFGSEGDAGGGDGDDHLFVFVARRRVESFAWFVPLSDEDLLNGVGAMGTPSRKADDTFEILLFMSMNNDES